MNVRIVELPEGDDPDSFVQNHGGNEFRERLLNAISFIDFRAKQFQHAGAFTTAEGKTQAVRSLVQSIAKMKDELKRNFYVKEVAEKYDVYDNVLFHELDLALSQGKRVQRSDSYPKTHISLRQAESGIQALSENKIIPPEERDILTLILEGNPDVIRYVLSNISLLQLSDERARRLAQLVLDLYDERGTIDATSIVSEVQDQELKNLITDLVMSRYELSPQWQEMEKEIDVPDPMTIAKDAVVAVRRKAIQKEMEENQHALKEASVRRDDATPYLQRQQELLRLKKEIESL